MPTITQNHYVLAVPDLARSSAFYTKKLGFREVFNDGNWAFVKKDSCLIMLGECPDDLDPGTLGSHSYFAYLVVDDADAYYRQVNDGGVEVTSKIADKPWKMREFGIRTVDGHRIMIGHDLD